MLKTPERLGWVLPLILLLLNSCTFDRSSSSTPVDIVTDLTIPNNPLPADGSANASIIPTLQWTSDNAVYYDVILDTNNPPSPVSQNSQVVLRQAANIFKPQKQLSYNTNYYWRVYAYSNDGSMKEGPVWRFTTTTGTLPLGSGYAMYEYESDTALPDVVNAVFQVVNMDRRGVTTLQPADFSITEDAMPITSESAVSFSKYPQLPIKIYVSLMLDNSSSLTQTDLDNIKSAAKNYVTKNITKGGSQMMKVFKFSETVDSLYSGFSDDPVMINNAIDNITRSKSSTDLYGAVVLGEAQLKDVVTINSITKGVMILFTDGTDTQGSTSLSQALVAIGSKSVFTIGLGNEIDPVILRSFGTSGYYPISSSDQLQSKFDQIQSMIYDNANSFYRMEYHSPKRGNFNHLITLKINNNPYNGNDSFLQISYNSYGF